MPVYVTNKSLGIKRPPSAFVLFQAAHLHGAPVPVVRRLKRKTPPKLSRKEISEKWSLDLIVNVPVELAFCRDLSSCLTSAEVQPPPATP